MAARWGIETSGRVWLDPRPDRILVADLLTDPRVRRYLGGPVPPGRLAAAIDANLLCQEDERVWCVRRKGPQTPIGLVAITRHKDGADHELSFQFRPEVWGHGLALAACRAALDDALPRHGRIIAETQTANAAARRLLERLGFAEIARLTRFGHPQVILAMDQFSCT